MSRAIELLHEALDALEAEGLADGASLVELHRASARLEANASRSAAAFEASGEWAADGAKTASAWIAGRCHVPASVARRRVHLGRAVRSMPATERAWLAGELTAEHVSVLAAAAKIDGFAESEVDLVEHARTSRWRGFCQIVAYWRQLHDEDGEEKHAARQVADRDVHLSQSFQDQWFLDGRFDPVGGTIVHDTWRSIERELFEADWAEARRRLGRDPLVSELARSAAQRRADAFVEMAVRARTVPAGGRRPAPLFSVFVDYETFAGRLCQLANGTVVTPGSLVPWLDEAYVERVVFGPDGRVLDVGIQQRLFTGADRRAVEARDLGECFHSLCDDSGEHLQIDHVQPYAAGGPTIQDNGRVACATHNRQRNQRHGGRPPRGP